MHAFVHTDDSTSPHVYHKQGKHIIAMTKHTCMHTPTHCCCRHCCRRCCHLHASSAKGTHRYTCACARRRRWKENEENGERGQRRENGERSVKRERERRTEEKREKTEETAESSSIQRLVSCVDPCVLHGGAIAEETSCTRVQCPGR